MNVLDEGIELVWRHQAGQAGVAALRADVDSLLRANGQAGGFMARPTGDNGDASMVSLHFDGGAPIPNEADNGLKNERGTVAMARTSDPNSATAQFFVNTVDNKFLNHTGKNPQGWGYAVFGKVVEGLAVVDKIEKVKTGNKGPYQNVPVDAVVITKASVL